MASSSTPATATLARAGVAYTAHVYEMDELPRDKATYGEAVAQALEVAPERLFKTLVAEVDGAFVLGIVPVSKTLDLRRLAAAAGGKRARLAEAADAERVTGYVTGGISPFGQKRRLPAFVDGTAAAHPTVFASGGRRGLQVELAPGDLLALLGAEVIEGLGA
jgi:Cys-tRNA(Pro)/Cys-tRNA(Cys) deacylase